MPTWAIGVLEWAVAMALKNIKAEDVKRELATIFKALDGAVQAVDARVTGPFKGVADEVALEFHECSEAVIKALES